LSYVAQETQYGGRIHRYAIENLPKSGRFTKPYRNVTQYSHAVFNSSDDQTLPVTFLNARDDETYQQFKMAAAKPEVVTTLDQ